MGNDSTLHVSALQGPYRGRSTDNILTMPLRHALREKRFHAKAATEKTNFDEGHTNKIRISAYSNWVRKKKDVKK